MVPDLQVLARLILALVFATAALLKLAQLMPSSGVRAGKAQRVALSGPAVTIVATIELMLSIALVTPTASAAAPVLAIALLLVFSSYIWMNYQKWDQPGCGCFGRYDWANTTALAISRNAILGLLAVTSLVGHQDRISIVASSEIFLLGAVMETLMASLAVSQLLRLRRWREQRDDILAKNSTQDKLSAITLVSTRGDVVRLSDVIGQIRLIFCIHAECRECEALIRLARPWSGEGDYAVVTAAPRSIGLDLDGHRGVIVIDQTFQVGHALDISQPPAICLLGSGRKTPETVAVGHEAMRSFLVNAAPLPLRASSA